MSENTWLRKARLNGNVGQWSDWSECKGAVGEECVKTRRRTCTPKRNNPCGCRDVQPRQRRTIPVKVTFHQYHDVPRTKQDALQLGWVKKDVGADCQGTYFNGERFWKDSDLAVILLYDVNGFIAGIQTAFDKNYSSNPNDYPSPQLQNHPLVEEGGNYHTTAYFIPSDKICSTGRTLAEFNQQGTGTGLWVQNGTSPSSTVQIPMTIEQVRSSEWTEATCFKAMGTHFLYRMSVDMDCDDFFPMFLLYNGGVLDGFGWGYGINLQTSSRFEHPTPFVFPVMLLLV
ncbi:uncharacterized protein LOC128210500 [Mya arenaria]|uniref:uncharacterized protein LOC128210500 n=1 Tax=Mya arenaria TaxID=6604 RepID=UPI0022DFDCA9|nr:uncharacterized protein LOC128210500 [Mya arenaria]